MANPSAMIIASIKLLSHLGLKEEENTVRKGLHRVLSEGKVRTRDLGGYSTTNQFTNAVINSL